MVLHDVPLADRRGRQRTEIGSVPAKVWLRGIGAQLDGEVELAAGRLGRTPEAVARRVIKLAAVGAGDPAFLDSAVEQGGPRWAQWSWMMTTFVLLSKNSTRSSPSRRTHFVGRFSVTPSIPAAGNQARRSISPSDVPGPTRGVQSFSPLVSTVRAPAVAVSWIYPVSRTRSSQRKRVEHNVNGPRHAERSEPFCQPPTRAYSVLLRGWSPRIAR